jgi:hypothetical protein
MRIEVGLTIIFPAACQSQPKSVADSRVDTYLAERQAEKERKIAAMKEATAKSNALLAKLRSDAGFPPEEDLTGTILKCDRLIKDGQNKILACARKGLEVVAPTSIESADVTADGIMALCAQPAFELTNVVTPYCIPDRETAAASTANFTKLVRNDVLGIIVTRRAAAQRKQTEPIPPPPKKVQGVDI